MIRKRGGGGAEGWGGGTGQRGREKKEKAVWPYSGHVGSQWGHRGILFGPSVSLGALANAWGAHAMGQNGGPSRGVANVSVPVGARNLASRRPLGAHLRATEAALGLSWGPGAPAGHPPSGHIENSSDARGHTNSSDSYTAQIPTRALKGWWDFFDSTLWHLYRSDLVQAGVFPRGRWRALLGGLSSGVAHMHSIGLVHADLSLSNICHGDGDVAVIVDMGGVCDGHSMVAGVPVTTPYPNAQAQSRHRAWVMGQRLSYVCRDLVVGLSGASGRHA